MKTTAEKIGMLFCIAAGLVGVAHAEINPGTVVSPPQGEGKTKVVFFFDTEDFIQPRSADAIRDIANILSAEGVRGHFAMIGYLGKKLVDWRRMDVLDALSPIS